MRCSLLMSFFDHPSICLFVLWFFKHHAVWPMADSSIVLQICYNKTSCMGGQLLIKEFICLGICNISQEFCVDRSMKYKKIMKFSIIAVFGWNFSQFKSNSVLLVLTQSSVTLRSQQAYKAITSTSVSTLTVVSLLYSNRDCSIACRKIL